MPDRDAIIQTVAGRKLWVFPNGRTLPVVAGGDETAETEATAETETETGGDDKPLGPEGEKALAAWKRRAKDAEAAAKRAAELEAELTELRTAQMTDQEKALADARREAADAARAEVLGDVSRRLFSSEVKAAITGKVVDPQLFDDPDQALRLLGLTEVPVTETGDIDGAAIVSAVASLIAEKPYLAASATRPTSIDQGTRPTTSTTLTLNEQISEAEAAGDWGRAGRLKLQKLAALPRP